MEKNATDFDFERMDVYKIALDFATLAHRSSQTIPLGYGDIRNQLFRSSISIVLNIAEGAGKSGKKDKQRFYYIARGSTYESLAAWELYYRFEFINDLTREEGRDYLKRIASMLTKLCAAMEARDS